MAYLNESSEEESDEVAPFIQKELSGDIDEIYAQELAAGEKQKRTTPIEVSEEPSEDEDTDSSEEDGSNDQEDDEESGDGEESGSSDDSDASGDEEEEDEDEDEDLVSEASSPPKRNIDDIIDDILQTRTSRIIKETVRKVEPVPPLVIPPGVRDWRDPNPQKIERAEIVLKNMKVKRQLLPSNSVFPVYTFQELSSIPTEFRVPITLELEECTRDERAQDRQETGYLVYLSGLVWGMMLPLHPFQIEILNFYNIIPAQLIPKGWWSIRIFIALCEKFKVPLSMLVFRNYFSIKKYDAWYSIY